MMEGKVGMRLENSTTRGKHELQVRCIPQGGSGNPDASRWRRSTPAYPASAMQLELFSAGGIRAHGFITILMKEQMSVIRRENEVLNACRRQLADGAAEVGDHLSAINLLFEFCGRQTEEFIQSQIHQIRNARGGELLSCWKIR